MLGFFDTVCNYGWLFGKSFWLWVWGKPIDFNNLDKVDVTDSNNKE